MEKIVKFTRRGGLVVVALLIAMSSLALNLFANSAQVATAAGGSGATLPYTEVQAENAATNGPLIDARNNRFYPGLGTEASGREAVTLSGQGKYVEFTVPQNANSIVMRYSIPDSAAGTGLDATLGLYINGAAQTPLALTSRYGWAYGGYPFNNNPSDSRPDRFYVEVHRLTSQMTAGTKGRVQIDSGNNAPPDTTDLVGLGQVGPAASQRAGPSS